jgi:hypothetical protein
MVTVVLFFGCCGVGIRGGDGSAAWSLLGEAERKASETFFV